MSVKQTKKLSEETATTTVAAGEKFAKVDANGNVTLIDLADLKAALLDGINLDAMMDGVFILYHHHQHSSPFMVKPQRWEALQNSGEIATGVVIIDGGKVLVVAPTDAGSSGLPWSSQAVGLGNDLSSINYSAAMNDWQGQTNTSALIAASTSEIVTNTSTYAPGFCNLYSRVNIKGNGLTGGKWWLPSAGEMMMIYANLNRINNCLSLISGATLIPAKTHWTSSDRSYAYAWHLDFYQGLLTYSDKDKNNFCVRPVSGTIN